MRLNARSCRCHRLPHGGESRTPALSLTAMAGDRARGHGVHPGGGGTGCEGGGCPLMAFMERHLRLRSDSSLARFCEAKGGEDEHVRTKRCREKAVSRKGAPS